MDFNEKLSEDVDVYGVPFLDHDPLLGLAVTACLIIAWYIIAWLYYKLKK